MKVCVNIDWLEVFCIEPTLEPRDPTYYERLGLEVEVRNYGTPQYRQMFTVKWQKLPFIEVRRDPYSLRREGGIFEEGACHIRLSNRFCYAYNPISLLRAFLITHGYEYRSISRIDLCCDFQEFQNHYSVQNFIKGYIRGSIWKINQPKLAAHGTDTHDDRVWNSLKWGSPASPVNTKLYNKSLELKEVQEKPYIRECWAKAEFNPALPVWRIEFSISSDVKGLVLSHKSGEDVWADNTLTAYDTKDKLWEMWRYYASKYFHFKKKVRTREGTFQRKDRCPDVRCFDYNDMEFVANPKRVTSQQAANRMDKIMLNRLKELYKTTDLDEVREAASILEGYYSAELFFGRKKAVQ